MPLFSAAWEIVKMVLMVVARYHRFEKFSQKLCHLWDNHNHHLSHITNTITIIQSQWPSQPHHTTPRPLHAHSWIRAPWHSLLRAYAPSKQKMSMLTSFLDKSCFCWSLPVWSGTQNTVQGQIVTANDKLVQMRNSGSLLQIRYYHKFYNYQSLVLLVSHRIAAQADIVVFLPAVEFVWKSIWLNLQEVSTCHMVFTDNCASTNQNSNYLVWVWTESSWFKIQSNLIKLQSKLKLSGLSLVESSWFKIQFGDCKLLKFVCPHLCFHLWRAKFALLKMS